jgi:hypothetical protein
MTPWASQKKRASVITVKDDRYRWVVSGNDGFLDLVIEHAEVPGQRLAIQMDYTIGQITPKFVRQMILTALESGWVPTQRGGEVYFRWQPPFCNEGLADE